MRSNCPSPARRLAASLIATLVKAQNENRLEERLKLLVQPRLLIVDEIGYLPIDRNGANLFFQLVSRRYERGSILVTSNLPFGRWGEVFGVEVVAAAMIDRLVHHAEVLTLAGDSYRTRARRELLAKERNN